MDLGLNGTVQLLHVSAAGASQAIETDTLCAAQVLLPPPLHHAAAPCVLPTALQERACGWGGPRRAAAPRVQPAAGCRRARQTRSVQLLLLS
jgi:hypothetical protein